jgi:hypothetical protein
MNFAQAFSQLRNGSGMYREGWNGVRAGRLQMVQLQLPDRDSKMTQPYLYIEQAHPDDPGANSKVPWLPSQGDLFAADWQVA